MHNTHTKHIVSFMLLLVALASNALQANAATFSFGVVASNSKVTTTKAAAKATHKSKQPKTKAVKKALTKFNAPKQSRHYSSPSNATGYYIHSFLANHILLPTQATSTSC